MATPGEEQAGDKRKERWRSRRARRAVGTDQPHLTRQPARHLRNAVLLLLVVAIGALVWVWKGLGEEALVTSAYAARTGCMCRYVSGRSLKSCEGKLAVAGLGKTAGLVWLSEDASAHTVTASIPLLASQSATFAKDTGCQLEPWTD